MMAKVEGSSSVRQAWLERVRLQDPRYAACFCEHARYVGSNRLFASKCEDCPEGVQALEAVV